MLTRWLACALTLVSSSTSLAPVDPPVVVQKSGDKTDQKQISRELARLLEQHFADQGAPASRELEERRAARLVRVREIVRAGQLATLDDWDNAAVVLHYGDGPEDFLLAHALVLRPGVADVSLARQLTALTLDHYLDSLARAEVFGSMSLSPEPSTLLAFAADYGPAPDSLRKLFTLDPLAGRAKRKGKAPSAKDLTKLAQAVEADPTATRASVREILAGGSVDSGKDFVTVARLLLGSEDGEDLLIAHVAALAAAFRGREEGLALAAESLDRYLLASGRGQLLGTVLDDEGHPRVPHQLAPEVVLRGYHEEAGKGH